MCATTAIALPPVAFQRAGVKETVVLLAVAWAIPFAVHLVPWSGERPLGAYLLPMFWATLVAVYFFGALTGIVTALCAPAINLAVTGLPALRGVGFASFELVVFVFALAFAVQRWPRALWLAPIGYVVAKLCTAGLQAVLGDAGVSAVSLQHSFTRALTGMIVLAAIHAGLGSFFPKGRRERG
jgi:hypothetical protein